MAMATRFDRRRLMATSAAVVGSLVFDRASAEPRAATPTKRKQAADRVTLGKTGIVTSRLALGSGTNGWGGRSDQTRLGTGPFVRLLRHGFDQGLDFWETADQYGAHDFLRRGMSQVGRKKVVVLTKTHATTAEELEADLSRFMKELGTDYLDIVLLHNMRSPSWASERAGAMEALERAKEKGVIRAHGVSCHTLPALRLAARTPWVEVDLARMNPAGSHMDADPQTVKEVLRDMKRAGKAVIGMKILGAGDLSDSIEGAISHAVRLETLDAFTIGFKSRGELDDVVRRIAAA
jgi:aryl-alcohol dehydrogenase-like predicted oxidoreductase